MSGSRKFLFLLAVVGLGCTSTDARDRTSEHRSDDRNAMSRAITNVLLPATSLPDELLLRQRITVRWEGGEESFEAVLQRQADALLLIGLGPMNSVGFTLTLEGGRVRFGNRSGRELPFEPARILMDVQRVFYPWIASDSPCSDCKRHGVRGEMLIEEEFEANRLVERSFVLRGDEGRGEVRVRYEGWFADPPVAKLATLNNGWLGYELVVETRSAERIATPSPR